MGKWVYSFGDGKAEGQSSMRNLLGGKGANLVFADADDKAVVRGIRQILQVWIGADIPDYNEALGLAIIAMIPPVLIVIIFQRMFIKGLVESEK